MQPPATNPAAANRLILVGSSARAAAESARLGGFQVAAIDQFGDTDTLEHCERFLPMRPDALASDFASLSDGQPAIIVGGIEHLTGHLDSLHTASALGDGFTCPSADQFLQLRDPIVLDELAAASGLLRPARRPASDLSAVQASRESWLFKKQTSTGGLGVQLASALEPANSLPAGFFERQIPGRCYGVSFLADRYRPHLIGVAASLRGLRKCPSPFVYQGSIGPVTLPDQALQKLEALGKAIASRSEIRGLLGVDIVIDPADINDDSKMWLLEINPRWTASMEVLERSESLIACHLQACRGERTEPTGISRAAGPQDVKVKQILYAQTDIVFTRAKLATVEQQGIRIADVPADGSTIGRFEPVCTLIAQGSEIRSLAQRLTRVGRMVVGARAKR